MCGIYGYVTADIGSALQGTLALARAALKHRGPDADGSRVDVSPAGAECGLAHTRLAILDLSPLGVQPMVSPDGRWTLVYNGEVYNYRALQRELEAEGVSFRSSSDTEVVLHALIRWGPAAVSRFAGMFALALWDHQTGTLLVARDRLGIKPLYLARRGHSLAFASELRTLLATGWGSRRFSRHGLRAYLATGSAVDPLTLVDGIEALVPGHILVWSAAAPQAVITPYWSTPLGGVTSAPPGWREELSELLQNAVTEHLVSDVPIGVFLSGGIDSSAVLALAAHAKADIEALTVTFSERDYDESSFASEVARHFGVRHRIVPLSVEAARQDLDLALGALDQPSHDGINTWFVSRAAREAGLKVVLSGTGGDEVFAGYPHFRQFAGMLQAGRLAGAVGRGLADAVSHLPMGLLPSRVRKVIQLLGAGGSPGASYLVVRSMFSPPDVAKLLGERRGPDEDALVTVRPALREAFSTDPVAAMSVLELKNYLRNTQLRDIDAMSMAHALEVRVPLLDHRVIELVQSLPGMLRVRGPQNKPMLIDAVPPLPVSATQRSKMGFVLPYDRWLRGPLKSWAESQLLGGPLDALGALDRQVVQGLWQAFLRSPRVVNYARILSLLALVSWSQRNGISA